MVTIKFRLYSSIDQYLHRSYISLVRNPINLLFRITSYFSISIFIALLYGSESGAYTGCRNEFTIEPGVDLMEKWKRVGNQVANNFSMIGFSAYFAYISSIGPVLLTLPNEFKVFLQVSQVSI